MKYRYMQILVTYYAVAEHCNGWVKKGWEVFTVLPSSNSSGGIGDCLILFRKEETVDETEALARFDKEVKSLPSREEYLRTLNAKYPPATSGPEDQCLSGGLGNR